MYAIIQTGGKQYRVAPGQQIKIESLPEEAGKVVNFEQVLLLSGEEANAEPRLGKPFLDGAKVIAEVVAHGRHKKVHILKFKRRKHQMKRMGHRQNYTAVKITGFELGGKMIASQTEPEKQSSVSKED